MDYNRHSIRLKGFDYSSCGSYFVTICVQRRECLFGNIHDANMVLNPYGKIVLSVLDAMIKTFPIMIDVKQIMPNHIHMIIDNVGAIHESPLKKGQIFRAHRDAPLHRSLLSKTIGYLKMNSSKNIHLINPNIIVWQRNYYEHIIRDK